MLQSRSEGANAASNVNAGWHFLSLSAQGNQRGRSLVPVFLVHPHPSPWNKQDASV